MVLVCPFFLVLIVGLGADDGGRGSVCGLFQGGKRENTNPVVAVVNPVDAGRDRDVCILVSLVESKFCIRG